MTGEKKSSDLSSRLGVRRSKTTTAKSHKSSGSSISAPPKAALATAKRFNDMLHPRSSKERERVRRVSDSAATRDDVITAPLDEARPSEDETSDSGATQRTSDLEQALANALEEQNSMREEIAKLKEHGQVYRETIEEYRRTLAGTYQSPNLPGSFQPNSRPVSARSNSYETENRRSASRSSEDLVGQNENLRARVAQLQDQLMAQEATYQSMLDQRRSQENAEWNELTARLHTTEKESQERLQQLLSLKSAFSAFTRVESQVADSELSEAFAQLSNRVREWVISNLRRIKLDFSAVHPDTVKELEAILPSFRSVDPANRLALFQALVSSTMMHIFDESVLVALPESGPLAPLRHIATIMQSTGTEYQNWRHATIRSLLRSEASQELREEKEKQLHRLATDVLNHLFAITSASLPAEAQSTLKSILYVAADFQTTLLLQKARYKVSFFQQQDDIVPRFDDNRMEPINELDDYVDEDGDVVLDRVFAFCVFPCLEKFGDEYGEHTDVSNVLVKSRVCCSVG